MHNLIFFLPSFTKHGAGNSIFRLCKNLNKRKYRIYIISIGKNFQKDRLKKIGCNVFELKAKSVLMSMKTIKELVKKISIEKANKCIFISSIHHANVFSIIFLRSIKNLKIIGVERTDISELLIFNGFWRYIKNLLIFFLVKIYYKKANLIVSNSISGKKDLIKICKTKVINIPSPSFFNLKYKKKPKKINELRIISVGRLSKEKGYKTIINALKKIKIKKFSMKILGDGNEKNDLKRLIKKNNLQKKIKLLGFKENTNKYYKQADLFVNASLFEGFPNALVEAISNDIPTICSNCRGGIKEIILNGRGGDLFTVNDEIELSEKITSFYLNPKKLYKKLVLARKNIVKYSQTSHVTKYEDVFNKI